MKAPAFRFLAAESIAEACSTLAAEEDAKVLAGGQSLIPLLCLRLSTPSVLVDLGSIRDLRGIAAESRELRIGAMTTHRQMERDATVSESAPMLARAAGLIAHGPIRTRGTVGGSLAHADPAGEWPVAMQVVDAVIEVQGPTARRQIRAEDLIDGPFMTVLEPAEIITSIRIPRQPRHWFFDEIARQRGEYGLAILGWACDVVDGICTDVRIAVGGATGTPVRARAVEKSLVGTPLEPTDIDRAMATLVESLHFTSDIHGSAEFRAHLTTVLLRRAATSTRQAAS